ncbi:MAG: DUF2513 domain-containing protein [Trueperaceae bacterium]
MKRDIDLIRQILVAIEKNSPNEDFIEVVIDGKSQEEIDYHVDLIKDAGFIRESVKPNHQELSLVPTKLTGQGYDFLVAIGNEKVLKKIKEFIDENAGRFVLGVVERLAVGYFFKITGLS